MSLNAELPLHDRPISRPFVAGVMLAALRHMSLRLVTGSLLDQDVDAIVNAWNRNIIPWWLLLPQGVSGAIKRKAGTDPFRELGYSPLPLGTARATGAGRLSYRAIIHVAAIDMFWRASEDSIARSAVAACELAVALGCRSIAMPVLGSGSGGFPVARAVEVIERALVTWDGCLDIRLVRYDPTPSTGNRG